MIILLLFGPLSLLGCVFCVELYATPPVSMKSFVLDLGYERTGDSVLSMKNPLYSKKSENPQFGYAVALMSYPQGFGEISGYKSVLAISAPGNPSLDITDMGFVEIQSLDKQPLDQNSQHGAEALVISPDPAKLYKAHTMFGTTVVYAPYVDGMGYVGNYLYCGAPEGVNCALDVPTDTGDIVSFESFGKVYKSVITYIEFGGQSLRKEAIENAYGEGIDRKVCYGGEAYGSDVADIGFAQANRNLLGFSGHLSKDGLYLLFGAPMFRQQAGTVTIQYRKSKAEKTFTPYATRDLKLYYLCDTEVLKEYKGYSEGKGKEVKKSSPICDMDLTYGYSLGSVKTPIGLYLVTGGPRAKSLKGNIKLFKFNEDARHSYLDEDFDFMDDLQGDEFNSGFGTTIVGIDLDGDGIDELLAGEPYYTDKTTDTYNAGRVSIFVYDIQLKKYIKKGDLLSPKPAENNMFGFKVASLGDIDDDGGEDLLVSALNEKSSEGVGVVHLFSGRTVSAKYLKSSQNADPPEVLQSFSAKDSELLGFSIGDARTDVDGNGFNDLIIGDPGKGAQTAHVYYANTFIRLLHPNSIPSRIAYQEKSINNKCPVPKDTEIFDFCQSFEVKLYNKGIDVINPLYPDNQPVPTKWDFDNTFEFSVRLEKRPDPFNMNNLEIYDEGKTVTFGRGLPDEVTLDFWIYGKIGDVFGATIKVDAFTEMVDGNKIELEGSDEYHGNTILAPSTFRDMDVSISPPADVNLKVNPNKQSVTLGSIQKTIDLKIQIDTRSGKEEHFVNGKLQISLGTAQLSFSTSATTPKNLASCKKQDNFVVCMFVDNKKFTNAELVVTMGVDKILNGKVNEKEMSIGYELTYANRKDDDDKKTAKSTIEIKYESELTVTPTPASVALLTPYRKGRNKLDYSFSLRNTKPSEVGTTQIRISVPDLPGKIEYSGTDRCMKIDKGITDDNCSEGKCIVYNCEVKSLKGNGASKTVSFKVTFLDKSLWDSIVTRKSSFWAGVEYEVTGEANYGVDLDKRMIPSPSTGSFKLETNVTSEKQSFPWWIVIVTLIVAILFVTVFIVVLWRKGFFTKRDPRKIREDEIGDDEYGDEDADMKLEKNDDNFRQTGTNSHV